MKDCRIGPCLYSIHKKSNQREKKKEYELLSMNDMKMDWSIIKRLNRQRRL